MVKENEQTLAKVATPTAGAAGAGAAAAGVAVNKVSIGSAKGEETVKVQDDVVALAGFDADQIRMLEEECILVDGNDKVIGHASKKETHLMKNIRKGMLHRAFSVFLFNAKGELLLQQRSAEKITFPSRWTNTCCSHPLFKADEMEEKDAMGVRRAAQRKLEHELGIKPEQIPLDKLHFLTRLHYLADSDGTEWGEHEVDWILFAKLDAVDVKVNANEVSAVQWVTPDSLKKLFADARAAKDAAVAKPAAAAAASAAQPSVVITPWFEIIANEFLFGWWKQLDTVIANKGLGAVEAAKIHKM